MSMSSPPETELPGGRALRIQRGARNTEGVFCCCYSRDRLFIGSSFFERRPYMASYRGRNDMRADIVPGATFPDYELTDHTRTRRRLSELQGHNPMILILSRGHFCPKDHQQHLELATFYSKIAVAYTKIVTISTDNILETNEFRDAVGAKWNFLSDSGRKIKQDLENQEFADLHHK